LSDTKLPDLGLYFRRPIFRQHGTYITEYAERIGLGSKKYKLVEL